MTKKQMGDAGEMLVAAELTLASVPASKMPDNWPGYDVVAQPEGGGPAQRISVKTRTYTGDTNDYVEYQSTDDFDWLAVVFLSADKSVRRYFVIPRDVADKSARRTKKAGGKTANARYWHQRELPDLFAAYEGNFRLSRTGRGRDGLANSSANL